MDARPIGIFDSGFGGLTVTRALLDLVPDERLVYVGDTARYPYGSKPSEVVIDFSIELTRWLIDTHDVKLVVVACNTASAVALPTLRALFDRPVLGVIDAGVRALVSVSNTRQVGVIGTVGTIGSGAYQAAVAAVDPSLELTCAACPGFVEFVERGELDGDQVHVLARRLLAPVIDAEVDALLLGCTHYPFLARTLGDVLGRGVTLVSSAEEVAFQVRDWLAHGDRHRCGPPPQPLFLSSGDVSEFERIGRMLLGSEMIHVRSLQK